MSHMIMTVFEPTEQRYLM